MHIHTHTYTYLHIHTYAYMHKHSYQHTHAGHWHHGAGVHFWGEGVVTVNASMLNGNYRLAHPPTVIDLPLPRAPKPK